VIAGFKTPGRARDRPGAAPRFASEPDAVLASRALEPRAGGASRDPFEQLDRYAWSLESSDGTKSRASCRTEIAPSREAVSQLARGASGAGRRDVRFV
jgi:hypothetical protein